MHVKDVGTFTPNYPSSVTSRENTVWTYLEGSRHRAFYTTDNILHTALDIYRTRLPRRRPHENQCLYLCPISTGQ